MPDTTAQPRLLNIPEVADYLGVNIRHIRRLVHERRIPFIKWGHLIRFKPADIDTWIDNNRIELGGARSMQPERRPPSVRSPQRRQPTPAAPPRPSADSDQLRFEP